LIVAMSIISFMELICLLGLIGIVISWYAIHVERQANKHGRKKYVALCDINDSASCSLVLTSEYAKLGEKFLGLGKDNPFNVPNTNYGLLFYIGVTLYPLYPFTLIPYREFMLFGASIVSIMVCCLLSWILYFKLKNFCGVCVASWILNLFILWQAWGQLIA
jgi:vitamin-K-epoxide reductase (warfarin-sensitive)